MKINIVYKFKDGAWGGGNQFLKALKSEFVKNGIYSDSLKEADILLFDSYQNIFQLIKNRFVNSDKKIIYRLGPVFYLHRGWKWKFVDYFVILIANLFADLLIFQSQWSYDKALKLGLGKKKKYSVIINAVNDTIFFKNKDLDRDSGKINLVYSSWSSNKNKGFTFLDFLDKNLDFGRYNMKFIGNSPIVFKNIKMIKPLPSVELAQELRTSDIFISPIKDDACSNAILEALACGLPVIALNSGGNGELIKQAGLLFESQNDLLACIETVSSNLKYYQDKIAIKTLKDISNEYILAIKSLYGSIDLK